MKKKYLIPIILGVLALSIVIMLTQEKRTLIIVGEENFPFEYYENGELKGIHSEFVIKIFEEMDIPFEVKFYSWTESINKMASGDADILLDGGYSEEREKFILYTDSQKECGSLKNCVDPQAIWIAKEVLYSRKDRVEELNDLTSEEIRIKKLRVGAIKGYVHSPGFFEENFDYFIYPDSKLAFKGLADNEIELLVHEVMSGVSVISELELSNEIAQTNNILDLGVNGILFSKKSNYPNLKKIRDKFYKRIIELKSEDYHEGIYKKYLNKTFTEIYEDLE